MLERVRPSGPAAKSAPAARGFRSDINGLRAIAIATVVAFHLAPGWAPGGFVGVDVFFVISGYLMTNIVEGRLAEGRFRLLDFYLARLRRIAPALAALCGALWLLGATWLDPWTFERLARDLPAALLFVSNFVFAGRTGYFAPDERDNWLLHTWSLGVEWQFYLLYPLALMGLYALPGLRRRLWPILAGLCGLSLVFGLALAPAAPAAAFYLLPSRAWELLTGALCAWAERRLAMGGYARPLLHGAGLVLIGLGVWLARPGAAWPSLLALAPVGGAALVIASGVKRTIWAENAAVAALGRASYSIYIWHWPVIVALRYAGIAVTPPVALAAAAGMGALGFASYRLIEQRFTAWLFGARFARPWVAAALAGGVLALSVGAAQSRGFEALRTVSSPPAIRTALADDRAAKADWDFPGACGRRAVQDGLDLCSVGDPTARDVLVIGDSHGQQIVPRYAHAFDGRPGRGATFLTDGGCLPIPGVGLSRPGSACARWADDAYRWAERSGYRRVVIISAWVIYYEPAPGLPDGITCLAAGVRCAPVQPASRPAVAGAEFARLRGEILRLRSLGKQVTLIGPQPQTDAADPYRLYRLAFRRHDLAPAPMAKSAFEVRAAMVRALLAQTSRTTGAALVDPLDALCPEGLCPVALQGRALYKDRGHFRASMMTSPRFAYLDPWLIAAH